MNTLIQTISDWLNNSGLLGPWLDALVKSSMILALAGWGCAVWRRGSAATKHFIWFVALLSVPCLMLLSLVPRSWQRPLWSVSTRLDSGNRVSINWAPDKRLPSALSHDETLAADGKRTVAAPGLNYSRRGLPMMRARFSMVFIAWGALIWVGGVVVGFIWFFAGQVRLRELSRNATLLGASERISRLVRWRAQQPSDLGGANVLTNNCGVEATRAEPALVEWHELLTEACSKLGLRRPVVLLESPGYPMPVTWGWWRAVILLPKEAAQWSVERRRVVLLHELAHVKRWDCLTQMAARMVCQFFWLNPLAWLAARRMCVERERASDDLVLRAGWKASDYATHLVEIARSCALAPHTPAVAMARSSQLQGRIAAIVDAARPRRMRPVTAVCVLVIMTGLVFCFGGSPPDVSPRESTSSAGLRNEQLIHLQAFAVTKEKQSLELAAKAGEKITPEYARFFDAATSGDWQTVTNMYESFKRRHPQYANGKNQPDLALDKAYWSPVLELCLVYDHVVNCDPKYTALLIEGITNSIPPGSIYFGGTDPGRGIPTAFSRSHADGDPFYTLTQNALADSSYLKYLQEMYGGKIYTPSMDECQKCFNEYKADAQRRLHHDLDFTNEPKQLRHNENIQEANGEVTTVSGQAAVMGINGLLTKLVFDRNPTRDFYIEESIPLEWMYPYLEPHGIIMKLNRQPLSDLPRAVVKDDHAYWTKLVADALGAWPAEGRSIRELAAFVEMIYLRKDLGGFTGNPLFVQNDYAKRLFSKLRSSIGGVYAWRAKQPGPAAEQDQMNREADFAFQQAFALCPYSPEAVSRYVNLLVKLQRSDDALLIARTAARIDP